MQLNGCGSWLEGTEVTKFMVRKNFLTINSIYGIIQLSVKEVCKLWREIYSFLGFWFYYTHDEYGNMYRVYYWCAWPWKFKRKFDLFKIKC